MVNMEEHRKPDGSIDWPALSKAETEHGDRCYECGKYLAFGGGHRQRCGACKDFDKASEVQHHTHIRCPYCAIRFDPFETDNYQVLSDGEHNVTCGECGKTFEVITSVSYTFTSPAIVVEAGEEDAPPED